MRTYGFFFALSLSLVAVDTLPSPAHPSQDPTAGASEDTAYILLTVSDNTGNYLPAPARESVQLQIGGQPVEIGEIRSLKDAPLFFSVLVDVSGSSKQFADQQILATLKLFRDLSIGDNHGYLILFKSEVATNNHFVSVERAEEILKHFPANTRSGGTALYDALIYAATEQLASTKVPQDSRRAIFVLSDGGDNSSRTSLESTLNVLRQQRIPVFTIGFSRPKGSASDRERKQDLESLKALNNGTGGWGTFLDEPGDGVGRAVGLTNGQVLGFIQAPCAEAKEDILIENRVFFQGHPHNSSKRIRSALRSSGRA